MHRLPTFRHDGSGIFICRRLYKGLYIRRVTHVGLDGFLVLVEMNSEGHLLLGGRLRREVAMKFERSERDTYSPCRNAGCIVFQVDWCSSFSKRTCLMGKWRTPDSFAVTRAYMHSFSCRGVRVCVVTPPPPPSRERRINKSVSCPKKPEVERMGE